MPICPSCQSIKVVKNGKTYYEALDERISLLGICRVFDVSLPWLLDFAESVWKAVSVDIGLNQAVSLTS